MVGIIKTAKPEQNYHNKGKFATIEGGLPFDYTRIRVRTIVEREYVPTAFRFQTVFREIDDEPGGNVQLVRAVQVVVVIAREVRAGHRRRCRVVEGWRTTATEKRHKSGSRGSEPIWRHFRH